jgi:putative Holliday junction resolvase
MAAILAIDPGTRYIGVAVSDPERRLAFPLAIIPAQPQNQLFQALREKIKEKMVDSIIVGRPLSLQGNVLPMTHTAEKFAEWLRSQFQLPVQLVDERLSTVEAGKLQTAAGRVDASAAALLLETFLQKLSHTEKRSGKEEGHGRV